MKLVRTLALLSLFLATTACEDLADRVQNITDPEGDAALVDAMAEVTATTTNTDGTVSDIVAESLPFSWSQVDWVSGDSSVANWSVTVGISSASVGSSAATWSYSTAPGAWATTSAIHNDPNACVGWVALIDGAWYGAIAEWLLPGQTQQAIKIFMSDRGNKTVFGSPLTNYVPTSGQTFYLFVCGLNWSGQSNVRERSNLVPVTYP